MITSLYYLYFYILFSIMYRHDLPTLIFLISFCTAVVGGGAFFQFCLHTCLLFRPDSKLHEIPAGWSVVVWHVACTPHTVSRKKHTISVLTAIAVQSNRTLCGIFMEYSWESRWTDYSTYLLHFETFKLSRETCQACVSPVKLFLFFLNSMAY